MALNILKGPERQGINSFGSTKYPNRISGQDSFATSLAKQVGGNSYPVCVRLVVSLEE